MSFEEINKVNLISFILLKKFYFDGIIVNADLNHKDQRFLWQPHYTLVACLNMTPMSVLNTPFFNSVLYALCSFSCVTVTGYSLVFLPVNFC